MYDVFEKLSVSKKSKLLCFTVCNFYYM